MNDLEHEIRECTWRRKFEARIRGGFWRRLWARVFARGW
jgi:hypothetical protein